MQIDYLRCVDCTKKLPTTTDHDCMWKTRWQSLNHKLATIQNNLKNKIFELKQQNLKMSEERTVFQTIRPAPSSQTHLLSSCASMEPM